MIPSIVLIFWQKARVNRLVLDSSPSEQILLCPKQDDSLRFLFT